MSLPVYYDFIEFLKDRFPVPCKLTFEVTDKPIKSSNKKARNITITAAQVTMGKDEASIVIRHFPEFTLKRNLALIGHEYKHLLVKYVEAPARTEPYVPNIVCGMDVKEEVAADRFGAQQAYVFMYLTKLQ